MATPEQIDEARRIAGEYQMRNGAIQLPVQEIGGLTDEEMGVRPISDAGGMYAATPRPAGDVPAITEAKVAAAPAEEPDPPPGPGTSAPAPSMPARVVPAQWVPGGHEVKIQHGIPIPDAARQAQRNAATLTTDAGARRAAIAGEQGRLDAAYANERARAEGQHAYERAKMDDQRAKYVQDSTARMRALSRQRMAEAARDPLKEWNERGTGAQFMSAIAVGLGAFGATLSGTGQNYAMDIINKTIDRNIQAHEQRLRSIDGQLDTESNLYRQNLDEYGSREKALLATKINYLDMVQAQLDQRRAMLKEPEAIANYEDLAAGVQKEIAKNETEFAKLSHDEVTEAVNEKFMPAQVVGGAGVGSKKDTNLFVPTLGGYARDEQTARKLNDTAAIRMQLDSNFTKAIDLKNEARVLSSGGTKNPLRLYEIKKELDSLAADSDTKKTVLEGQGAMSRDDKSNTEESIGAMRGVLSTLNQDIRSLKRGRERNLEHHRIAGESYGIKRGTAQYQLGPSGWEERAVLEGENRMPSGPTTGADDKIQPLTSGGARSTAKAYLKQREAHAPEPRKRK